MDRTQGADGPVVQGFSGRGFRVDGGVYEGLVLTPDRADGWSPPAIETLDEAAFGIVLAMQPLPEFVVLGTGTNLRRPPRTLVAAMEARGVGIEPMDSRAAARAWGVLRAERRHVAALLYPLD